MNPQSHEAFKRFLVDTGKRALEVQGEEYIPTVVLEDYNGSAIVMVLMGAHPFDMLGAALPAIREHRPSTVSITVDSYMAIGLEGVASRELFGGSLARAHAAGAPGVTEALMVHIVTPDSTDLIMLPYVREDDGHITWGEQQAQEGLGVGGRMTDALRMVWVS